MTEDRFCSKCNIKFLGKSENLPSVFLHYNEDIGEGYVQMKSKSFLMCNSCQNKLAKEMLRNERYRDVTDKLKDMKKCLDIDLTYKSNKTKTYILVKYDKDLMNILRHIFGKDYKIKWTGNYYAIFLTDDEQPIYMS